MPRTLAATIFALWLTALFGAGAFADSPADRKLDFNRDIRPILSNSCYACHGPDSGKRKGDPPLRLDSKDGLFTKREGTAPFEPGDPDNSLALMRITSDDPDVHMPPPKANRPQPTAQQIETLT